MVGPIFRVTPEYVQVSGRNVQLTTWMVLLDNDMTWEIMLACFEYAKTFASAYPGWDFHFEIFDGIGGQTKLLGAFNMKTIVMEAPSISHQSSLLTAGGTNATGRLQLFGSNNLTTLSSGDG